MLFGEGNNIAITTTKKQQKPKHKVFINRAILIAKLIVCLY